MASVTIASATVPNWQLTNDVQLRIYALQAFIAADGNVIAKGIPGPDESESANFFATATCTLSGTTLTIAAITLESTTDSQDNASATYGAFFYTAEGEPLGPFAEFASFQLPAAPTSTTWGAIALANQV